MTAGSDLPLDSREMANVAEKEAIAKVALAQIQTGDTVFFDASSTVFHLACLLANLEVTVLTNGLKVAIELARRPAVEVILVGGVVSHRSLSCQGTLTDQVLESYHVQKVFMSCRGLDAERGLSEANVEQAGLRRKIIRLSDQTIVLADHTKMGLKSSYFFAGLQDVDLLITDHPPEKRLKQALHRSGCKLLDAGGESNLNSQKICLAVDLGASSGRVVAGIYDGARLELNELNRFPNDPVKAADGWHWNLEHLLTHVKQGIALAVKKYGEAVVSAGVDTWGVDYGLLDADGKLLCAPFQYRDSRTRGMQEDAFRRMPRREIYQRTGIQFMFFNTLFQLLAETNSRRGWRKPDSCCSCRT